MTYKPVLGIKSMLVAKVLNKVPAKNRIAGVVLEGINMYQWGVSILFIKQQVLVD